MKVKILKTTRIEKAKPGEIVEVSPARAVFLLQMGLAEAAEIREQIETPEKPDLPKRTTRKRTK